MSLNLWEILILGSVASFLINFILLYRKAKKEIQTMRSKGGFIKIKWREKDLQFYLLTIISQSAVLLFLSAVFLLK